MAVRLANDLKPGDRPILLLSGGELTVTRTGDGVGGPNAEFCLALALALPALAARADTPAPADEVLVWFNRRIDLGFDRFLYLEAHQQRTFTSFEDFEAAAAKGAE